MTLFLYSFYRSEVVALTLYILLSVLLCHSAAQDIPYIPVNVADLDPLQTCNRRHGQLMVVNNKAYYVGGLSTVRNGTSPSFEIINSYLRVFDFTKSRNLNSSDIVTARMIPPWIPITSEFPLSFATNHRLYFTGGTQQSDYLSPNGQWLPTNWTYYDLSASNIYYYDISQHLWVQESALQPENGRVVKDTFCFGAPAWNSRAKKAYYWKGNNYGGSKQLYPGGDWTFTGPTGFWINSQGLLEFDPTNMAWVANETSPGPPTDRAAFISVPGLETDTDGVLVAIGGRLEFNNIANVGSQNPSMRQITIYDTKSRTWFNQTATVANGGNPPAGRSLFCAVTLSAPDNSSHNIYIYGGQHETDEALDDVWILTIPSFQWISVGATSVPRFYHSCALLGDRYIATYGGVAGVGGNEGTFSPEPCDTAQSGLRLFDLTTFDWAEQFELSPSNYSATVPKQIHNVIGGGSSGGATVTVPIAGFDDPALATVFARAPISSLSTSTTSAGAAGPSHPNIGSIAGEVIGAFLGFLLIIGSLAFFLRRRRKHTKKFDLPEPASPGMEGKERVMALEEARHELNDTGKERVEVLGQARHELWATDEAKPSELLGQPKYELPV